MGLCRKKKINLFSTPEDSEALSLSRSKSKTYQDSGNGF